MIRNTENQKESPQEKFSPFVLNDLILDAELTEFINSFADANGVTAAVLQLPHQKELATFQAFPCLWADTPSPASNETVSVDITSLSRRIPVIPKFKKFCELVRKSHLGNLRCWCSDIKHGQLAFQQRSLIRYHCHMGLDSMIAPILVGGRHVANIYVGPFYRPIAEDFLREQYDNLTLERCGISYDEFAQERSKILGISEEKVETMRRLLQSFASFISERATASGILRVLQDIGKEIGQNPDFGNGLHSFIKHIKRLLNCETSSVWIVDPSNPADLVGAAFDWSGNPATDMNFIGRKIPIKQGLIGKVMRDVERVLLTNRAEIDAVAPYYSDSRNARKLGSFLAVPMLIDGTAIGVIEVGSRHEESFIERDAQLLATIALHAAAFTQNARLKTALMDVIPARNFQNLAQQVVRIVPHLINGMGSSLFLKADAKQERAYLVASSEICTDFIVHEFFSGQSDLQKAAFYDNDEGLTGWVLANGVPLNLELRENESRYAAVSRFNDEKPSNLPPINWANKYSVSKDGDDKAWIGVPLKNKTGDVIGVLRVSTRSKGNFSEQELSVLNVFAQRVETAILEEADRLYMNAQIVEIIMSLANAIDAKDPYTEGHSRNVKKYSEGIGKELGLTSDQLARLGVSALLHDIGKIGIPDVILSKPGKLNRAEARAVQMHPEIGRDILSNVRGIDDILQGIVEHHEAFDGTGYPKRLRGEKISLFGRIIAVADAFDAIVARRPYKDKVDVPDAIRHLKNKKSELFDPKVVDAFINHFVKLYDSDPISVIVENRIIVDKHDM